MKPKLHMFISLPRLLQPFLVKYQTSVPMIPLLFDDVKSLLISLCSKVVKPDIMAKEMSIRKLYYCILKKNLLPIDQIDIRFAAKSAIKKVKHHARK